MSQLCKYLSNWGWLMIVTKLFEVRDRSTFIPVMATEMRALNKCPNDRLDGGEFTPGFWLFPNFEAEAYLLKRTGYPQVDSKSDRIIALSRLTSPEAGGTQIDPCRWVDTVTMQTAHQYIVDHWPHLESGDVIDCEYIRGESSAPKTPERAVTGPLPSEPLSA